MSSTQTAIEANLLALSEGLAEAARLASEAHTAMRNRHPNVAIGTVPPLEHDLPVYAGLLTAILALHRRAGGCAMTQRNTPTPWHMKPSPFDNELLILSDESCVASVPLWEDDNDTGTFRDQSYANAALIVRACNAHRDLVASLKLALEALNTARRFRVNDTDSYAIASRIDAALKKTEVMP
ncbi:MAG: hypothetical protein ACLPWS_10810 [Rhodomicrobium sp.]